MEKETRNKDRVAAKEAEELDDRVLALWIAYQRATKHFITQYKQEERAYLEYKQLEKSLKAEGKHLTDRLKVSPPDYDALRLAIRPFLQKWTDGVKDIRAKDGQLPYNGNS